MGNQANPRTAWRGGADNCSMLVAVQEPPRNPVLEVRGIGELDAEAEHLPRHRRHLGADVAARHAARRSALTLDQRDASDTGADVDPGNNAAASGNENRVAG